MVGRGFTFDSSLLQRVSAADSADWILGSTTSNFSIDAWVNLTSSGTSQALVSQSEGNGDVNRWLFWVNNGTLQFEINVAGSGAPVDINSNIAVPAGDGKFHHVAVVRTGANYTFYLDKVAGTNVPDNTNTAIPDVNALLNIGSSSGDSNFVNGQMDEVEIFNNTAITTPQISAIFDAQDVGKVTFTVTNTNDSGAGSLRDAITKANASAVTTGREVIGFDIFGVTTISLASALPPVTGTTIIDGFTQVGSTPNSKGAGTGTGQGAGLDANNLLIELNAASSGAPDGLQIQGQNSVVRGLTIGGFGTGAGINVTGSGTHIEGNDIGADKSVLQLVKQVGVDFLAAGERILKPGNKPRASLFDSGF
jgi:hypothetical protein